MRKDRRQKGIPWLSLGLTAAGLFALVMGLVGFDLLKTWMLVQTDRREADFASNALQGFAPSLDLSVIRPLVSDEVWDMFSRSGFADTCEDCKAKVGEFQGCDQLNSTPVAQLIMQPHLGNQSCFGVIARYKKGSLMLSFSLMWTIPHRLKLPISR
jgi:hypothetical protein